MSNDPTTQTEQAQLEQAQSEQALLELVQGAFNLARQGDSAGLGTLLASGLPVNLSNEKGDTLLMLSAYHGHLGTARMLLEAGADPERRNDQGQTPMLGAAFKGDAAMTRLLLAHGAQVESSGPGGKTALMTAAMFDRTEIVDLLLKPARPGRRGPDRCRCRPRDGRFANGQTPGKAGAGLKASLHKALSPGQIGVKVGCPTPSRQFVREGGGVAGV